ncbi:hypothetical protein [Plasmodium yoelii yoelii]|uniref:Uncharacterized protein n=1 Tax=Plasmodium yoelii yoelii TaxID=73239 RepID=Q7RDA9_PLAYO|nr:hypothetical protein [Plasmodium yoelii yoelii]
MEKLKIYAIKKKLLKCMKIYYHIWKKGKTTHFKKIPMILREYPALHIRRRQNRIIKSNKLYQRHIQQRF